MRTGFGKLKALAVTAALVALGGIGQAQKPTEAPKTPRPPNSGVSKGIASPIPPKIGDYERSIAVDPRVNISMCVGQADVKINGWSRDEIRLFVKDGSNIAFTVQEKNPKNGKPAWVKVAGVDLSKPGGSGDCAWGDIIEIDAPRDAAISVEGREMDITADSVRKINVKNAGGNIRLRNIAEGLTADTYDGDIDVESSWGPIKLGTTSGNIVAFELKPSEIGDTFAAKTNGGNILLQAVDHKQIDVSSISGSVAFNGELLDGGVYNLGTQNGSLILNLPTALPCSVTAIFISGNFNSELPIKLNTENIQPGPMKTIHGELGKGDCKLSLTNASGSIRLRKIAEQKPQP